MTLMTRCLLVAVAFLAACGTQALPQVRYYAIADT